MIFAADRRAPTPSAAAEIVIPEKSVIQENIAFFKTDIYNSMENRIKNLRLLLKTFDPENMCTRLQNIEQRFSERFDRVYESIIDTMNTLIQERRIRVQRCTEILENCNPQTIFDRGYSMVTDSNGNVIRNSEYVSSGDVINIRPSKGIITARVTKNS